MGLYVNPNLAIISARFGEALPLNKASNTKRCQLVVGNWKMNGNRHANAELLQKIVSGWLACEGVEVVVCPAFPYLQQTAELVGQSTIRLGAQTLSEHGQGAYTGEVSASMLLDLECRYVIVGHNERRRLQRESDQQVAQKFVAAQAAGLVPILCVGESADQRQAGQTLDVIDRQLRAVIEVAGVDALSQSILAYEPIWAVGTGLTATPDQAQQVHEFIRSLVGGSGSTVSILYGGSVKAHNAAQLFAMPDIDGALLGGASLDAEEFLSICASARSKVTGQQAVNVK